MVTAGCCTNAFIRNDPSPAYRTQLSPDKWQWPWFGTAEVGVRARARVGARVEARARAEARVEVGRLLAPGQFRSHAYTLRGEFKPTINYFGMFMS